MKTLLAFLLLQAAGEDQKVEQWKVDAAVDKGSKYLLARLEIAPCRSFWCKVVLQGPKGPHEQPVEHREIETRDCLGICKGQEPIAQSHGE